MCTLVLFLCGTVLQAIGQTDRQTPALRINDVGYYSTPWCDVTVFDDFYPEGHQGGLTIVQCGTRVAANGDVRLEPAPGQWAPVPRVGGKRIDRDKGVIAVDLWYPDSSKDRKGFNPIDYPDLRFRYTVTTVAEGEGFRVVVDLDSPLPAGWANKVGFNLELFPGHYFGEHFLMDGRAGAFPRQANGPMMSDQDGGLQITPLATGKRLIVCPGTREKELTIVSNTAGLTLLDARGLQNNGWFVVRSTIPDGAVKHAVEWVITPKRLDDWRYRPVIQVSQVGYHPGQSKFAVIELDKRTEGVEPVQLIKLTPDGPTVVKTKSTAVRWGNFLRYQYLRFDFTMVTEDGLYKVRYGDVESNVFEIGKNVFARHVWQPTVEYFLPVQMCHMRINDRYKVWHGLCHMDDASMAPINHNHFDGYYQQGSTLTRFAPADHVPGLNVGGWHDAGDYDLRIESQAATVYRLAQAYEYFNCDYDVTSINQTTRVAELHKPDGVPDVLQQIDHGVRSIVGGYEAMGRLYRGIICPTLRQYVHLGDASTMSDNLVYTDGQVDQILHRPLPRDDRWVFTEENVRRELYVAQTLAATARVMRTYDADLAERCLRIAEQIYAASSSASVMERINAAAELYVSTSAPKYEKFLRENRDSLTGHIDQCSDVIGKVVRKLNDPLFTQEVRKAVKINLDLVAMQEKENPYGVPYKPHIWGAGWGIQSFGVRQLFLHMSFPDIVPQTYAFHAMNFILGCHPGENSASFVSGVGSHSLTVAYGVNRDEWSHIPGGVASGTALIRPDLPELKVWPYFWQQTEYVMGGGAIDFMILAMAADHLLNK